MKWKIIKVTSKMDGAEGNLPIGKRPRAVKKKKLHVLDLLPIIVLKIFFFDNHAECAGPEEPTSAANPIGSGKRVDEPVGKSALEEKLEEDLFSNIREHKGELPEGQRISDVRRGVENSLDLQGRGDQFNLIQQIEQERSHKEGAVPATNTSFREIVEYQVCHPDGREEKSKPP